MMIPVVFDLLMSAYQGAILVFTLRKQFVQIPHSFLYEIGCVASVVLYFAAIQYGELPLPDSLVVIFLLAYILLTTRKQHVACVLWTIVDGLLFFGTLTLVSSLFDIQINMNGSVLSASEDALILYCFAGNASVTVVLNIAAHIFNAHGKISRKEMLLFILLLLFDFLINECFFMARLLDEKQSVLLAGSACAFISMIFTMILYGRMTETVRKQRQAEMTAQTARLVSSHQNELKSIYMNMLAQQHDLRHRISAAEEILSSNALETEQKEHVLKLLRHNERPLPCITGNIAVDAILTAKSTVMKNAGIEFDFVEYPIPVLPLPEDDFCMLIGNLLDNAIEGVERLPKDAPRRHIRLAFSRVWDMLFITCVNDANIKCIKHRGDTFISTKARPELHGFGIENMKRVVQTAGGTIEFEVENDRFTVQIMLGEARDADKDGTKNH